MKKQSQKPKPKLSPALFSSKRDDWETPAALVEFCARHCRALHGFDVDFTATAANTKARNFCKDFLNAEYIEFNNAFMNPPYGRNIGLFVNKAIATLDRSYSTSMLAMVLPARTDTAWFHRATENAAKVMFLQGRVHFEIDGISTGPAPFPTAIIIREPRVEQSPQLLMITKCAIEKPA